MFRAVVVVIGFFVSVAGWSMAAHSHEPKSPCGAGEYRFRCDLQKKTKANSWEDSWRSVAKADIFLCFNNRGNLNEWLAMIDHFDKGGEHVSNPLAWFNTVIWNGGSSGHNYSWKGTGARLTEDGTWMTGDVAIKAGAKKASYREKIYKGKKLIRKATFKCKPRQ
jgi:hypothetical protein